MIWKKPITFDDLDEVLYSASDDPYPEGKNQVSEIDLDAVREELDDER